MSNLQEMDKKWYTNKDVARIITEVLAYVKRSESELSMLREEMTVAKEEIIFVKEIVTDGNRTTNEIKNVKFIGQEVKFLEEAKERVKGISGKEVRRLINRAATAHTSGRRKGFTEIYNKLIELTGFDVYEIGKVRLTKNDGIDGWKPDPSYINTILREGYGGRTAIICTQILADR